MQCNLSSIELELTIENTIIQLIAHRVGSTFQFRRFQTMMNLCWVGCWNRVPGTTEIPVFVSLVHSLPCSQSLHCHRAQESEVFQKANARRSLPSRRRVRTFAPMYQCTYILTLNEFLSHESPFLAFRKAETPHTHLHTVQCHEFRRGSVTGSGGSRNLSVGSWEVRWLSGEMLSALKQNLFGAFWSVFVFAFVSLSVFRGVRGFVTLKPIFYALQLLTGPVEINDAVKFQEKF